MKTFSSPLGTHLRGKPDELRQDIQVSDDITQPTLCSEEEVGALEGVLHRRRPDGNTPHIPLLLLAVRKESPSARQRCPIRMKTSSKQDCHGVAPASITAQDNPYSYLIRATRKKKYSKPQIGTRPGKPETSRTNQVGTGAFLISLTAMSCHNG